MIFLLFFHFISSVFGEAGPLIESPDGTLQGRFVTSNLGNIGAVFQGIPYAAPPLDKLRFQNPAEPERWTGTMNATDYGPACWQNQTFSYVPDLMSEDCLHLSIWVPPGAFELGRPENRLYPVMYYVHGGGYQYDSPRMFPVEQMIDSYTVNDVIVVLPSYRLGVFGAWTTFGNDAPGNLMIKDLIQGLKWVQRSIRSFGGDPTRVTIQGHSSGGGCVSLLSLLPAAHGLFHQLIPMSGSSQEDTLLDKEKAKLVYTALATDVGCTNTKSVVECMQSVDPSLLMNVYDNLTATYGIGSSPFVDSELIPFPPSVLIPNRLPMNILTGNVINEFPLFTRTDPDPDRTTIEGMCVVCTQGRTQALQDACVYRYDVQMRQKIKTYRYQPMKEVIGDCSIYTSQYNEAASMLAAGAKKVYLYSFDFDDWFDSNIGPAHSLDLRYLFDIHHIDLSQEGQKVREFYGRFFSNFIKNGTPHESAQKLTSPGFQYFSIDQNGGPKEFFHFDGVQFWNIIAPYIELFSPANKSDLVQFFTTPKEIDIDSNLRSAFPILAQKLPAMVAASEVKTKKMSRGTRAEYIVIGTLAGIAGLAVVVMLGYQRNKDLKAKEQEKQADERTPLL